MTTQVGERRKVREGRVVSDHMDKTVVVAVERRSQHRLYKKSMRHVTKFVAHDEANIYQVGDVVRIVETRPLSKTKRWRVIELLVRREVPDVSPEVAAAVLPDETVAPAPRRRGPTRAAVRAAARRAEETGISVPAKPKSKAAKAESEPEVPESVLAEVEDVPVTTVEMTNATEETPSEDGEAVGTEEPAVEPEVEETPDEKKTNGTEEGTKS